MDNKSIPQSELIELELTENSAPKTVMSMKDAVSEFVENNLQNEVLVVGSIHSIFEKVVGSDVVKHVKVKHVRDKVLFLEADHAAWAKQIKFISSTIIFGLCEELGEDSIKSIDIVIGMGK